MRSSLFSALIAVSVLGGAGVAHAQGTLFVGSDVNTFSGSLPDKLGVVSVNGANFVSQTNYSTTFHINGFTDVSGQNFLYAGDPFSGVINRVDYTGNLLGSISVPGIATGCCNEDMIWTGSQLYHGQYSSGIQLIDLNTGNITQSWSMPDIVGMSFVGSDIWISQWSGRSVGIWDPSTGTYTAQFSTPNNAGGLAFDPVSSIMWVGMQGGTVVPYQLDGTAINAGFQPFGNIGDTIDGLAFLGEVADVPEPATWGAMALGLTALAGLRRRRGRVVPAR